MCSFQVCNPYALQEMLRMAYISCCLSHATVAPRNLHYDGLWQVLQLPSSWQYNIQMTCKAL